MIDVLRKLLELRECLSDIETAIKAYGVDDEQFPEIAKMRNLEHKLFRKVEDWSKP